MDTKNIISFKNLTGLDEKLVGRKATRIAELANARIPVPRGFVITNTAYFDFLQKNNLKEEIYEIIKNINFKDPLDFKEKTDIIRHTIFSGKITEDFKNELAKAYAKLGERSIGWLNSKNNEFVAIRSSIISTEKNKELAKEIEEEAGNLNIKGLDLIIGNVKECWASLFSKDVLLMLKDKQLNINDFSVAVIVQQMVIAKTSGILLTSKNQNERNNCVIEAVYGFGGRLLLKEMTPDHYEINKKAGTIINKQPAIQEWQYVRVVGATKKQELSKKEKEQEKLDKLALKDLTTLAKKIETCFGVPQKIEWVIKKKDIFVLNTEPLYKNNIKKEEYQQKISGFKSDVLLRGVSASNGIANGLAVVVNNSSDLLKVTENSIIVTEMTNIEMNNYIKKARAVVTDKGSAICHAAVVCQKLHKPCVVNTKTASKEINTGATIQVNGNKAEVCSVDGVKLVDVDYKKLKYEASEEEEEEKPKKKKVLFSDICYEDISNIESIEFPINKLFTDKELEDLIKLEKKEMIEIIKNRIVENIKKI